MSSKLSIICYFQNPKNPRNPKNLKNLKNLKKLMNSKNSRNLKNPKNNSKIKMMMIQINNKSSYINQVNRIYKGTRKEVADQIKT